MDEPITEAQLLSKSPRYGRLNVKQAERLYAKGYSTADIGKLTGVHQTTVWKHLQATKPERQALQQFKNNRADVLAKVQAQSLNIQAKILDTLQDRDIEALTPQQKTGLVIALNAQHGTLFDKERLERGQSTSNQSIITSMLNSTVKSLYQPTAPKRHSKKLQAARASSDTQAGTETSIKDISEFE